MIPKVKRILELTQPFYHNCPGPPHFPLPQVDRTNIVARDSFNMEKLTFVTHTGTHIDAPYHFLEDGKTVDAIDPAQLQGRGVIVDLFDKKPGEPITDGDLKKHDDLINEECIVLLCTGWGYKRDFTEEWIQRSPWLNLEGASYLVRKKVKGVGIDHFSLSGNDFDRCVPPHKEVLGAGLFILEDLFLPKELLCGGDWYIIALPMFLRGGTGGPVRVVAAEFDNG